MNIRIKKARNWSKDNAALIISSVLFILSMSFMMRIIVDNHLLSSDQMQEGAMRDMMDAMVLMGFSGFVILIIVGASSVNLLRSNKKTKQSNRILKNQVNAIEACGDGIAILDERGCFVFVNKAHAQIYGYSDPADLIGHEWRILYGEQRITWFEREVFTVLEECGEWRGRSTGEKKDGTEFPQELRINKVDDGGLICIVRDISEKVRNENLLRMIKVAIEAAEDGIAITDDENRLLFMNRSFLKIHGYDPYERDRYLGTDWRLLYNQKGQEQINNLILPTTILKGAWSGSTTVMKKDGTLFEGDASLTKLHDGTVLGVMRDVTARRSAEKEREELREQLFMVQKMEAIGRLTHGITHDFNNILSIVQGYCRSIKDKNKLNEDVQEFVEKIDDACLQAHDLVGQLMAFTRKRDHQQGMVDLNECIKEMQELFDENIGANITPVIDIRVDTAYIDAQYAPIYQMIHNLISNAIEALGNSVGKIGVTLKESEGHALGLRNHVYTDIMPERAMASVCRYREFKGRDYLISGYMQNLNEYYHLIVADTGPGIDRDILQNIFDPFFTTKRIEKKTGLGLFTVLGTVIGYNGAIIVETVPKEGTSFHIFLPKAQMTAMRDHEKALYDRISAAGNAH